MPAKMMTYILMFIAVVFIVIWGLSPRQPVISPDGDKRKTIREEIATATGWKRLGLLVLACIFGLAALGFFLADIAELDDSKPAAVRSFNADGRYDHDRYIRN